MPEQSPSVRIIQGQETYNSMVHKDPAIPLPPLESPLKLNAETSAVFYQGLIDSVVTTYYTVPSRTRAELKEIHVCNKSSSNRTFTIRLVQYGQSTSDTFALYCDYPIKAKESITFWHKTHMYSGWFISALASNAGDITMIFSGVEVLSI